MICFDLKLNASFQSKSKWSPATQNFWKRSGWSYHGFQQDNPCCNQEEIEPAPRCWHTSKLNEEVVEELNWYPDSQVTSTNANWCWVALGIKLSTSSNKAWQNAYIAWLSPTGVIFTLSLQIFFQCASNLINWWNRFLCSTDLKSIKMTQQWLAPHNT